MPSNYAPAPKPGKGPRKPTSMGKGGKPKKQNRNGSSRLIHPVADLMVVSKNFDLSNTVKEVTPGAYAYAPGSTALFVGKLSTFAPLLARSKVQYHIKSYDDIYVTWAGGKELMVRDWKSGWIDLHELAWPTLRAYGNAPSGQLTISCAGLAEWEMESSNRFVPDDHPAFAKMDNMAQLIRDKFRVTADDVEESESEDEDKEPARQAPVGQAQPKPTTPPRPQANTAVSRALNSVGK